MIPDFVNYTVDVLCEGRLKAGFYSKTDELRKLENDQIISILYCDYEKPVPQTQKELIDKEYELILEIAVVTKSILFISDLGLKDEANFVKQPVIHILPKFRRVLKSWP